MSADDRLAARIGAALVCRVDGATRADVKAAEWRGRWRAWAHVYALDGTVSWSPRTEHPRKRDALRALAAFARIPEEELSEETTE